MAEEDKNAPGHCHAALRLQCSCGKNVSGGGLGKVGDGGVAEA